MSKEPKSASEHRAALDTSSLCLHSPARSLQISIALLAIAVSLLDHFHGHDAYLLGLNTHRMLLPEVPAVHEEPPPALARRVVVLFIDGLGADAVADLEELARAATQGTRRALLVDFPTFTYPGVVALVTGVPPLYSGLRLNHPEHACHLAVCAQLPTLLEGAQEARIPVRIHAGGWPGFHDILDYDHQAPELSLEEILLSPPKGRSLDWIYFGEVDEAGHNGGKDSAVYRYAAQEASRLMGQVLSAVDLSQDVVVVVSDHGHLPRGGHGGVEPEVNRSLFVAVGAGIRAAGELPDRMLIDVAPTVAALLGIPPPAAGLGRPMLDVLAATPARQARILAPAFAARVAMEERLKERGQAEGAPTLLSSLRAGDPKAIGPAERLLDGLAQERQAAYEAAFDSRARPRLLLASAASLLLLGALLWLHRRRTLRLLPGDLWPTLVYTAVFSVFYFGAGYGLSWSIPRGEAGFLLETFLYGALGVAAAFALSRRRARFSRLCEETVVMLLVYGIPYFLVSAWAGLDPAWLAGPLASFLVIFFATVGFYAYGPFGIFLLIRTLRASPPKT